jgi:hypothetical protein
MSLQEFFRANKYRFLYSALAFASLGFFFGLIKKWDIHSTSLAILAGIPFMFLMAYGLYEFIGGDNS